MEEYPLFVNLPYALTSFSDYNGNALDRRVFTIIAQFANRRGVSSCMTTRSIAARVGRCREAVSKSVNRIVKKTGLFTITKEKRGQDKHPRNIYHIVARVLRRYPDKRSSHYNAAAWKRWCEIGKKRAITIALKKKAAEKLLTMAGGKQAAAATPTQPASASPTPAVQLTPAQARKARQQRGGGFDALGDALRGMGLLGAPTTAAPAVKDAYRTENRQRGDLLQQLRQHEAQQQAAAAMASQATPAAAPRQPQPVQATASSAPVSAPTQPTASEQRERKAQAYEELQQLRERLRRQPAPVPMTDTTTAARMAAQAVARDYARASRPAASSSPWPSSTAPTQPVQQPATTPAVEQDTQATRDYWKRKLRQHEAQQQAAAAGLETR